MVPPLTLSLSGADCPVSGLRMRPPSNWPPPTGSMLMTMVLPSDPPSISPSGPKVRVTTPQILPEQGPKLTKA